MKTRLYLKIPIICASLVLGAATLHAQATRTWVSGVGDDANPCSRTAPCKTFAGAISKTAVGGEINVLDPGGFGAVTITKAITISSECFEAGVLVSGTNGIIVNVPNAGDDVTLRGIDFEGLGTGLNGITLITGGTLHVQKCTIKHFTNSGINFAPTVSGSALHVSEHTVIANNNAGNIAFAGVLVKPTSGASVNADVNGVQFENNANGVTADGTGGGGAMNVNVRDSKVASSSNSGIVATTSGPAVKMTVDSTMVVYSANTGVASNGAAATVRIGSCTISNNVTGVAALGGSTFQSFKNNQIASNTADGTPINAVPGGPLN
jgi:hypothetical protein